MTVDTVEHLSAGGCEVSVRRSGQGPRVLLLHGSDGTLFSGDFIEQLSRRAEVLAPVLPGWAPSGRAPHVTSVDDLSFVVLDLIDQLRVDGPVHVVGCSFGAWVGAEAATKAPTSIASLTLVAPLGIKTGGRTERAFVDIYATSVAEVRAALYADEQRAPDFAALDADGFRELAMAQEAVARFGWEPYLHNPKLIHRLGRLDMPCLIVGGSEERFVLESTSLQRWAEAIGDNAAVEVLPGVGHRVEEEAPESLAELVGGFLGTTEQPKTGRDELAAAALTRGA